MVYILSKNTSATKGKYRGAMQKDNRYMDILWGESPLWDLRAEKQLAGGEGEEKHSE